ncbi:MAG TPA: pyridoxal phosphate-dependent aminotransferase [Candidatus Avacidaminococcus intestinavium]|uniref:cysteine-S-conjugate beta-lyase n=1 Tax=Candidatus Avacidaminococcus intestinavium TaxID=2840684 RepID=A0A9D1MR02_9FIRM|nr:pyridoxal phosphate-dependent aminotransferase [Candidatus Avacidaminococcus intestinavium]
MTNYDFDKITNRKGTNCLKYDFALERGKPANILPFWVADMDFPVPEAVIEALINRSKHGIFGYTDIKLDYLATLEKWFQLRHGWQIKKEALVMTPGVVFALAAAVRAFTKPGDAVLIQRPVYYPFSQVIEDNGRKLINNSLVEQAGRYTIDFVDFEQKIIEHKIKLFILCNPHNPVGRVWTKDELLKLGQICVKQGVVVVADEIHQEFTRLGHAHTVFAGLCAEFAEQTITCTAPSKTFNLAGLQISNIFIENARLRAKFMKAVERVGYSQPNALGVVAAQAAYADGGPWLDELKVYLELNLQKTQAFLVQHLPQVKLIEPEGTYLLWLDFSAYALATEVLEDKIVNEAGLWLDGGTMFGPEGSGFQRINMACPWSVLEKGLQRLAIVFAQ